MTGDAVVGYELTWTAGTFTGGVKPYTIVSGVRSTPDGSNFGPVSSTNPYKVSASDLGLYLQPISTCTDAAGQTLAYPSGLSQTVARPVLDEYDLYVDGVLHDPSSQLGLTPNQTVVFEIKPKGDVNFNPKDVTFAWSIRSGTGRLSGDTDKSAVIYMANDTAPSAALVQCRYASVDANDNAVVDFEILVSSAKTGVPVEDMIKSFTKPLLKKFVSQSGWADSFDKELFKLPIAELRAAVLEAYRLASASDAPAD